MFNGQAQMFRGHGQVRDNHEPEGRVATSLLSIIPRQSNGFTFVNHEGIDYVCV